MKYSLLALCVLGCALQKDPNQQGNLIVRFEDPEDSVGSGAAVFDSIELNVFGEFGVITAEGGADKTIILQIPPGPARVFQVIARNAENPVLLGVAIEDVLPGGETPVNIQMRGAAGFTLSLLDTGLSLLPLDSLQVSSVLDPNASEPTLPETFTLTPRGDELLPLPTGVLFQLEQLPSGLRAPEGEGFLFLDGVGVPVNQELVLLRDNEAASIELSVEGLSLRVKVVDSLRAPVAISGSISLVDESGLLSLPPLISLTEADNGEVLLTNVLTVLPGVFGVAAISAELDDVARSKGSLPVVLLDVLPAGAPVRLVLLSASETLEGLPRPEPGDLIIAAVDILGRVATSAQLTVTLNVSAGGRLRSNGAISDQVVMSLNQGLARLSKGLLPTGSEANLTVTATAAGVTSASVVVAVE